MGIVEDLQAKVNQLENRVIALESLVGTHTQHMRFEQYTISHGVAIPMDIRLKALEHITTLLKPLAQTVELITPPQTPN